MIVTFNYKNWRGEVTVRHVKVESLDFYMSPGFGYQPGWFLSGICQDKKERRSFALTHIQWDRNQNGPQGYTIPLGE